MARLAVANDNTPHSPRIGQSEMTGSIMPDDMVMAHDRPDHGNERKVRPRSTLWISLVYMVLASLAGGAALQAGMDPVISGGLLALAALGAFTARIETNNKSLAGILALLCGLNAGLAIPLIAATILPGLRVEAALALGLATMIGIGGATRSQSLLTLAWLCSGLWLGVAIAIGAAPLTYGLLCLTLLALTLAAISIKGLRLSILGVGLLYMATAGLLIASNMAAPLCFALMLGVAGTHLLVSLAITDTNLRGGHFGLSCVAIAAAGVATQLALGQNDGMGFAELGKTEWQIGFPILIAVQAVGLLALLRAWQLGRGHWINVITGLALISGYAFLLLSGPSLEDQVDALHARDASQLLALIIGAGIMAISGLCAIAAFKTDRPFATGICALSVMLQSVMIIRAGIETTTLGAVTALIFGGVLILAALTARDPRREEKRRAEHRAH